MSCSRSRIESFRERYSKAREWVLAVNDVDARMMATIDWFCDSNWISKEDRKSPRRGTDCFEIGAVLAQAG